jgi:hypothetical protein
MNVSPLLKKSIEVTLQEILPKMNARSNFFKFFPNYDVPGEAVSSPRGTYATVLLGKSSRRCSRYSSYFFGRVALSSLILPRANVSAPATLGTSSNGTRLIMVKIAPNPAPLLTCSL